MESGYVEERPAALPTLEQDPALGISHRAKIEILLAILLGLFLGALDQTVVGTALPRIVTDLGGNELYTWVVTIYLLTSTISVPFYGKLSDIYGRKPLLMIGITLFLIGSALSGLSQEMWQLILFRGIQGLGAGALFPISLAVIGDLFTPAERGRYQGLFGAVFGISFIVGPALGGFLTDQVSWHWVFYVNIPIGIVSLYTIWRLLPTMKAKNASRNFDYLGGLVFTISMILLLVGLTNKVGAEWTAPQVGGLILAGLVGTAIFLVIEWFAKEPIVPLDLWRGRTYSTSMLSTFLVSFGFFGAIIFLPRWFQVVRGDSATASGYEIFPMLIGLIGSSIVAGALVSRTGKYKALIVGALAIMSVGLIILSQTLTTDVATTTLWIGMFITGIGIGPTLSVYTIVVQNAVPFSKLGVATSNLTFFRQIGGSVGLAIAGTLFATSFKDNLVPSLVNNGVPQEAATQIAAIASSGQTDATGAGVDLAAALAAALPPPLQALVPNIVKGIYDAFSFGVSQTFLMGVVTGIAALICSLFMRELALRKSFGPETAPAAPAASAASAASTQGTVPATPAGTAAASTVRAEMLE